MHRLSGCLVVVSVVGLTGVACGLGGPSKQDYAEKADPICRTANTELSGVTRPTAFQQVADAAGKVAQASDNQVQGLRKIEKPKEDKAVLERALRAMGATSSSAREVQAAVAASDLKTVESAVEGMRKNSDEADQASRDFGLAQCGRGAKDVSTSVADASRDVLKGELIAKADAVCAETNRRMEAVPEPKDRASVVRSLDQVLALADKGQADLRGLSVPESQRAAWTDVLGANDQLMAKLRELRAAAAANDGTKVERLTEELDAAGLQQGKKAAAFGLKKCGLED